MIAIKLYFLIFLHLISFLVVKSDDSDKQSKEVKASDQSEAESKESKVEKTLLEVSKKFCLTKNIPTDKFYLDMKCWIIYNQEGKNFAQNILERLNKKLDKNFAIDFFEMSNEYFKSSCPIKKNDSIKIASPALVINIFKQNNRINCLVKNIEDNEILLDESLLQNHINSGVPDYLFDELFIILKKIKTKEVNFLKRIRLINHINIENCDIPFVDNEILKTIYDTLNLDPRLIIYSDIEAEKEAEYNVIILKTDNLLKIYTFSNFLFKTLSKEIILNKSDSYDQIYSFFDQLVGFKIKETRNIYNNNLLKFALAKSYYCGNSSELFEESYNIFSKAYSDDLQNILPREEIFYKFVYKFCISEDTDSADEINLKKANFPYVFNRTKTFESEINRINYMIKDFENLARNFDLYSKEFMIPSISAIEYYDENQKNEILALQRSFIQKYVRTFGIKNTLNNSRLFFSIDIRQTLFYMEMAYLEACNDKFLPLTQDEKDAAAKQLISLYFEGRHWSRWRALQTLAQSNDIYLKKHADAMLFSSNYQMAINDFKNKQNAIIKNEEQAIAKGKALEENRKNLINQIEEFLKTPYKSKFNLPNPSIINVLTDEEINTYYTKIKNLLLVREENSLINNCSYFLNTFFFESFERKRKKAGSLTLSELLVEYETYNKLFNIYESDLKNIKTSLFFVMNFKRISSLGKYIGTVQDKKIFLDTLYTFMVKKIFTNENVKVSDWTEFLISWVELIVASNFEIEYSEQIQLIYNKFLLFEEDSAFMKDKRQILKNLIEKKITIQTKLKIYYVSNLLYTWDDLSDQNEEIELAKPLKTKWVVSNNKIFHYVFKNIPHNKFQLFVITYDLIAKKFLPIKRSEIITNFQIVNSRPLKSISMDSNFTCFNSDQYCIAAYNFLNSGKSDMGVIVKIDFSKEAKPEEISSYDFNEGIIEEMALLNDILFLSIKTPNGKIFVSYDVKTNKKDILYEQKNDGLGFYTDVTNLVSYEGVIYLQLFDRRGTVKEPIYYLNSYTGRFKKICTIESDSQFIFNFKKVYKINRNNHFIYNLDDKLPSSDEYTNPIHFRSYPKIPFKEHFFSYQKNIYHKYVIVKMDESLGGYEEIENSSFENFYGYAQLAEGLIYVTDKGVYLLNKSLK